MPHCLLRHPHPSCQRSFLPLPFFFLEQSSNELPSAKSPTSAPPSSNRRRPKLPHLSSFLLSPSDMSPDRRTAGKQGFSGRRPSMAIELHLDVELLAPATIFFAQQLKSTLGEALMLVLSVFPHVHKVSALVPRHAAAGRGACRRRTPREALAPPHATFVRAPEPLAPAGAHLTPLRRHLAPPPPGRARRRLPCFAPPLGRCRCRPPRRLGARMWAPPHHYCRAAAAECWAGQGRPPLPLTSGARWSGGI